MSPLWNLVQSSLELSIPRNKKVLRGGNSTTWKRSKTELITKITKYRLTMTGKGKTMTVPEI